MNIPEVHELLKAHGGEHGQAVAHRETLKRFEALAHHYEIRFHIGSFDCVIREVIARATDPLPESTLHPETK